MKTKSKSAKADELRAEYPLARLLPAGVQGKYAARLAKGTNLVPLAPDVAKAFPTAQSVNDALRLVIQLNKLSSPRKKAVSQT